MTIFESETFQLGESGWSGESYESYEAQVYPLHEAQTYELAGALLEVSSEEELERFLGNLVRSVAKGASALMRSPVGGVLKGALKSVAKTALPMVGSALGSMIAPGVGTAIGGKLGSMASNLFEEGEAESYGEQAEMEAARRYVQWAAGTIRNAARAPRGLPPRVVVRSAAVSSARRYAPALLRRGAPGPSTPWRARRRSAWTPYPMTLPAGAWPASWDPSPGGCSCGGAAPTGHSAMPTGDGGGAVWSGDGPSGWSDDTGWGSDASDTGWETGALGELPGESGAYAHEHGPAAALTGEAFGYEVVPDGPGGAAPRSGKWVRRGAHLVLLGAGA
jgi:hypothetical protein